MSSTTGGSLVAMFVTSLMTRLIHVILLSILGMFAYTILLGIAFGGTFASIVALVFDVTKPWARIFWFCVYVAWVIHDLNPALLKKGWSWVWSKIRPQAKEEG